LDKATRDLPPATKRSLQTAIDKMLSIHGSSRRPAAVGKQSVELSSVVELSNMGDTSQYITEDVVEKSSTPHTSHHQQHVQEQQNYHSQPSPFSNTSQLPPAPIPMAPPAVKRSGIVPPSKSTAARPPVPPTGFVALIPLFLNHNHMYHYSINHNFY